MVAPRWWRSLRKAKPWPIARATKRSRSSPNMWKDLIARRLKPCHARSTCSKKSKAAKFARAGGSLVLFLETALDRRNATFQPFVRRERLTQCPGRALEAALDDVVAVVSVEIFDVQADPRVLRKRLEPLLEEFGIHLAEFGLGDLHLPDQIGPVGNIDGDAGQT